MRVDDGVLRHLCIHIGVPITSTNLRQARTLVEAFQVFCDRNEVRRDLWREAGAEDAAQNAKSKVLRLPRHVERLAEAVKYEEEQPGDAAAGFDVELAQDEAVDDGLDLINYAAFFVRNVREGRLSAG